MVRSKVFTLILIFTFIMGSAALGMAKMRSISTQQAHDLIEERDGDSDFVILDVRTLREYEEGYIEDAVNMDFYADTFTDELDGLDRDNTYLLYCRSGSRSRPTPPLCGHVRRIRTSKCPARRHYRVSDRQ